jgi:hypothetical protein
MINQLQQMIEMHLKYPEFFSPARSFSTTANPPGETGAAGNHETQDPASV